MKKFGFFLAVITAVYTVNAATPAAPAAPAVPAAPESTPSFVSAVYADITPPVGTLLAGYSFKDVSIACHTPLNVRGVIIKNSGKTAVLLSFDLIALEDSLVKDLRKKIAAIVNCGESDVMLTCTHTHGAPHTRITKLNPLDAPYCKSMIEKTLKAVREANSREFLPVDVFFYSSQVAVNTSRRYTGPEHEARFTPKHRHLEPMVDTTGIDRELGTLIFRQNDGKPYAPKVVIGNYAAHPLVTHAPGLGGLSITSDYPGRYRELVEQNTGAFSIFTSGACGEVFPLYSESGYSALDKVAKPLATSTVIGMVHSMRNANKFRIYDPQLRSAIIKVKAPLRSDKNPATFPVRYPAGAKEYELELQFLAIGDVCFVGVPGEFSSKMGLEIKWHSPFRRTWILYNSTGYNGYFSTANDFVAGGYESTRGQHFQVRTALQLVQAAVDGLFQLHDNKIELKPYAP